MLTKVLAIIRKVWLIRARLADDSARQALPQQAQAIESISGHTYIRKRISLTFSVKKLILLSHKSDPRGEIALRRGRTSATLVDLTLVLWTPRPIRLY